MEFDLDNAETRDLMDGIIAWYHGFVSSGIHDEGRKEQLRQYLNDLADVGRSEHALYGPEFSRKMRDYVLTYYLSDEAIEQGYGWEDLTSFVKWLADDMGIE